MSRNSSPRRMRFSSKQSYPQPMRANEKRVESAWDDDYSRSTSRSSSISESASLFSNQSTVNFDAMNTWHYGETFDFSFDSNDLESMPFSSRIKHVIIQV